MKRSTPPDSTTPVHSRTAIDRLFARRDIDNPLRLDRTDLDVIEVTAVVDELARDDVTQLVSIR